MLRPSYNEVPQGFGGVCELTNLALSSLTLLSGANIRCSLVSLTDVGQVNRYGNGQALTAGQWLGVGAAVPFDPTRREPYLLSLKGFGRFAASGGLCLPFIGSTTLVSSNTSVAVHDIMPGVLSSVGLASVVDFVGAVRPGIVFDGVLAAGAQLCVGVAFCNPTVAACDLTSYRVSISCLRAAMPDNALDFSVN